MTSFVICFILILTAYLCDLVVKQREQLWRYFMWFLLLMCACYATKVYGSVAEARIPGFIPYERMEHGYIKEFKFVPKGTPPSHVNDDDTPSDAAKRLIRGTNRNAAVVGWTHHKSRLAIQMENLKELCWYCPDLNQRQVLKIYYNTFLVVAIAPGVHAKLAAAFLSLAGQLGEAFFDNYTEIYDTNKMIAWHSLVLLEYELHMKDKGWM